MSHELHYTSVPRGLKPGSRGFCTVATTPNLSRPLAERLESLSGYQAVFPPGDPSAALNPIVHAHVKMSVSGRLVHVLSRIGPAGLDYSSRPNKYAHHVVLELDERRSAGPAWLLGQRGFLETDWIGEPHTLSVGRVPPQGDRQPSVAVAWQALAGDAGWAGVLAEAFLADPRRPAYLVFRPGMQLLPLFEEAIALLPPARRWDVEFSTYFTQLPQGITCAWRGVLDGSDEASQAARLPGALVIDLCRPPGRAHGGALVQSARTGERIDLPNASAGLHPLAEPSLDVIPPLPTARGRQASPQTASSAGTDLIPEMAALLTPAGSRAFSAAAMRPSSGPKIAAVTILLGVAVAGAAILMWKTGADRETAPPKLAASHEAAPLMEPKVPAPWVLRPPAKGAFSQRKPERAIPGRSITETPNAVALAEGRANTKVLIPTEPPATPITPPAPKSQAPPPKEPLVGFFAIPRIPSQGRVPENAKESHFAVEKDIHEVEFLRANENELDLKKKPDGREITIRTKSISATSAPIDVAKLRCDKKLLSFAWESGTQQESDWVAGVLDSVIKIRGEDGETRYVLLRDPGIPEERGALALLFKSSARGPRPRYWSTYWAAKDGLKATTRQFLIRRWRVACSYRDETGSFMVESKADASPMTKDEQPILPDLVSLKIWIDEKDSCNIHARFEPGGLFKERRAELEARIAELEGQNPYAGRLFGASLAQRALDLRSDAEYRLRESRRTLPGDERTARIGESTKETAELKELLKLARIYSLVNAPERGDDDANLDLSVVVCLRIDTGIVVDVARFGDFAKPAH